MKRQSRERIASLEASLSSTQAEMLHITEQLERERAAHELNLDRQRVSLPTLSFGRSFDHKTG